MELQVEELADTLISKTKHYLSTIMGRFVDEASLDESYRALSMALREEIMINWLASAKTHVKYDVKMLYYLSMEYLPGRILYNNIFNLSALNLVKVTLQKLNLNLKDILEREHEPGLGNGGLGRLASCFLDSLATLHYPSQAYGLRYQYGMFEQQIWDGVQIEAPDVWLIDGYPWEFRRDNRRVTIEYCGRMESIKSAYNDEIFDLDRYEEVWALPYDIPIVGYDPNQNFSVVTLRLWTTKESPRNFHLQRYNAGHIGQAAENTTLTDVLYPSEEHEMGRRIRLKQEFLLVSASLQDIIRHYLFHHKDFQSFPDKVRIQINDTHPSLTIAELIRLLTSKHNISWQMAVEITKNCVGYTNHTILREALEEWDQKLMYYLLPRQYRIIERLNYEFLNKVRRVFPKNEQKIRNMSIIEEGKVRMANLAIVGSHSVNGVAKLHSEILKNHVFKDFYDLEPEKFVNVTNGVTHRRWLLKCNPRLAELITEKIGNQWITDFDQIEKLRQFASDPKTQEKVLEIKRENKEKLISFLKQTNQMRNKQGKIFSPCPSIDIDSLFDIQIKRIHEYKRQLMNILHTIMLYQEMLENPSHNRIKRTVIFGGKAAAGYKTAKEIIRLICCVARTINHDPVIKDHLKVIFIENYCVSKAEKIIPAAELSEQISTAGMEASGTGNMKLTMNGALTIGTNDGANIEMRESVTPKWWPFVFGAAAEELAIYKSKQTYNAHQFYLNNEQIKRAVNSLKDHTFAINNDEHHAFCDIFQKLTESHYGGPPDRYFTLYDLQSFYETQKKVEELYKTPLKWTEMVIQNIGGMGEFSTDRSIKDYCTKIWDLQPCPPDPELLAKIRKDFASHDKILSQT